MKGDVFTCGMNTKEAEVASLAGTVGVVFQDPETQLFTMSVEDEVAFGLECAGMALVRQRWQSILSVC
ncbi:ATP-binding cassette domain-containing protein [Sediminispirochaeta smaragdinae]|uniref:hypothetical protein n=1 Tax=Sediminispirochaeta smaragdinae TaxID=55206 RepID=UPI000317D9FC|nr:hypothetical protein [Sediminispirochaeta smaragdinae]